MDREAWWARVHGVTQSQTQLRTHTHTHTHAHAHTHTHTHTHRLRRWFKNTRPVLRSMSKLVGEGLGL